ncbi:MAG: membrane integrity-associated transporter subunit PqiC [Rhodospirillales bacterium]|nr:MAG: membrane integrity-associated transporter subunit PqiC [Rhodospirillales bacterium]
MPHRHVLRPLLLLAAVMMILTGCTLPFAQEPPPIRFYVLSAAAAEPVAASPRPVMVGVSRVVLPEYLDTPRIVTRTGANELRLADLDQWRGTLRDTATATLVENLTAQIPSDGVVALPFRGPVRPDFQVAVEMSQFERDAEGLVTLAARWQLLSGDGRTALAMERATYRRPAPAADYAAIVAAMSDTLAELSRDIASAIRRQ